MSSSGTLAAAGCLEAELCEGTTVGDLFKLAVPAGWTVVAVLAALTYLISPLQRGDPPRYAVALLIIGSAIASGGLSTCIYQFYRTLKYTRCSTREQAKSAENHVKMHGGVALFLCVVSSFCTFFFAVLGPSLNACGHASCGADAAWSIITLLFSTIYGLLAFIAWKNLTAEADVAATRNELESQSMESTNFHGISSSGEAGFGDDGL